MIRVVIRRKPVPRAWREEHHSLTKGRARAWGYGFRRTVRQKGECSCGEKFPSGEHADNYSPSDLMEAYNDHVAQAFHGDDYYTRTEVEV